MEINAVSGDFYRVRIPDYQKGRFSPFGEFNSADVIAGFIENPSPQAHEHFSQLHGREIDDYLSKRGLVTSQETRKSLDVAVARAIIQAIEQAFKFLSGDFRPDPLADRFATLPDKSPNVVLPLDE